jgi:alpha-L-fucosidase
MVPIRGLLLLVALGLPLLCTSQTVYKPTWDSLDARPLPDWYDNSKFGIFIHWGVFSVPSYTCGDVAAEWYWNGLYFNKSNGCIRAFHDKTYGPDFKYPDFAKSFRTELFDASKWANLFLKSGAKYVVLTSKHHEGFTNWPSAQSWNWNSADVGPGQDNVGLVTAAVRKVGLRMGLYHSLYEWFNPLYLADHENGGKTTTYVDTVLQPQLHDIVNRYQPEIVWADGDWEMNDTYWRSKEFLAWLYNESPVKNSVVVNDRWGAGDSCRHGGYYTCADRYNPGVLQPHKWENCLTIDSRTWGFARNGDIADYLSIDQLLSQLASTVACNGNFLLNVGPTGDGVITPVYEERLLQIGAWLDINGEAIYNTKPWRAQNDTASSVWYTAPKARNDAAYAIFFGWPKDNVLRLTQVRPQSGMSAQLLGYAGNLQWKQDGTGVTLVVLPDQALLSPQVQTQSGHTIKLVGVQ